MSYKYTMYFDHIHPNFSTPLILCSSLSFYPSRPIHSAVHSCMWGIHWRQLDQQSYLERKQTLQKSSTANSSPAREGGLWALFLFMLGWGLSWPCAIFSSFTAAVRFWVQQSCCIHKMLISSSPQPLALTLFLRTSSRMDPEPQGRD